MLSDPIIDGLTSGMAGLRVCGMLAMLLILAQRTIFALTMHLVGRQAHRGAQL